MIWQRVRIALLAGVVLAGMAGSARAGDCCESSHCGIKAWFSGLWHRNRGCCEQASACCEQPAYRTEYRQETYTAYRNECVPETRTRTCTIWRQVPETRTEVRNVCVCVPHVEDRTVMERHVTCKPVTHMVRRCVDKGHYECREVPCCESGHRWFHKMKGWFKRGCGCQSSCENSCDSCCPPPMKTVQVWVPCKVWEETPVTCMQRVCECRPVTCKVTVYRQEVRQEKYQVTCCRSVPEQRTETYQVMVSHRVPYQACRTVCFRVPCAPAPAPAPCCETTTCCKSSCGDEGCCGSHRHHWFHKCGRGSCESTCGQSSCHRMWSGFHFGHKNCCD